MTLQEAIEYVSGRMQVMGEYRQDELDSFKLILSAARKQADREKIDCSTCNNQHGKWGYEACDSCVRWANNNWTPKEE